MSMVYLPSLFTDHMVLQRGMAIPVWGWAEAGQQVTVTVAGQTKTVTVGQSHHWQITLDPLAVGPPLMMTITNGDCTITLNNILVGDVWLCAGQSNMEFELHAADNGEQELAAAPDKPIRLFNMPCRVCQQPQIDVDARWQPADRDSAHPFSAVGYFFGSLIHREIDVPVGLINASWGSTIETWISRPVLESDPDYAPILQRFDFARKHYQQHHRFYYDPPGLVNPGQNLQWHRLGLPRASDPGIDPTITRMQPSGLFNAMINPLIPAALRGVIWYQGESNADRAFQYRKLFAAMIGDWRRRWDRNDLPFLFAQLPNFGRAQPGEFDADWAELREAQAAALALTNTGMAVTIDIGRSDDLHPPNKQQIAARLADVALQQVYGHDVEADGPVFEACEIKTDRVRVSFLHADTGLTTTDGQAPRCFIVAGADQNFAHAAADIEGSTVLLHSTDVPNPVTVRYAWANDPPCNLINKAGLPAAPFRTDDWPGITHASR